MSKTGGGNFFEDFRIGQVIKHAVPRTITVGDVALYNGLFGPRFAAQSSDVFARAIGYPCSPIVSILVFHVVFAKTVQVIGLKENSSRKTGIVFVRSTGCKADGSKVLEYVYLGIVRKRDETAPAPGDHVP